MKVLDPDISAAILATGHPSREANGRMTFFLPDDTTATQSGTWHATNQFILSPRQLILTRGNLCRQIQMEAAMISSFFNPKAAASLTGGISRNNRKGEMIIEISHCLYAQSQAYLREDQHCTEEAIAEVEE